MTALSMRSAVSWPAKVDGRTGQKVRRRSAPEDMANGWYLPESAGRRAADIMKVARRLLFQSFNGREKGRRRGALTVQDVAVLEYLAFDAWDWKSGKLDCAYSQICAATRLARATVARALDRLEALGLLERMRRFRRTELPDGSIEVHQVNNAYRLLLPARLRALIGLKAPPPPDDLQLEAVTRRIETAEYETEATGRRSLESSLGFLGRQVIKHKFTD